nr:MFS transporter [Microbacterium sp.]
MVMMAIAMASMFGTLIVLPLYLQSVLVLDPLATGLMLLPGSLLMGLLGPVIGRIYDKRGPRPLLIPGTVVVSAALWTMATFGVTTPVPVVLVAHIALCAGLAPMFTPLFATALGSLQPQLYSHGSAVIGTAQQLAGAAGTALLVTVLTAVTASAIGSGVAESRADEMGVRAAFLAGAIVSLVSIAMGFFVRRTVDADTEGPAQ